MAGYHGYLLTPTTLLTISKVGLRTYLTSPKDTFKMQTLIVCSKALENHLLHLPMRHNHDLDERSQSFL